MKLHVFPWHSGATDRRVAINADHVTTVFPNEDGTVCIFMVGGDQWFIDLPFDNVIARLTDEAPRSGKVTAQTVAYEVTGREVTR